MRKSSRIIVFIIAILLIAAMVLGIISAFVK